MWWTMKMAISLSGSDSCCCWMMSALSQTLYNIGRVCTLPPRRRAHHQPRTHRPRSGRRSNEERERALQIIIIIVYLIMRWITAALSGCFIKKAVESLLASIAASRGRQVGIRNLSWSLISAKIWKHLKSLQDRTSQTTSLALSRWLSRLIIQGTIRELLPTDIGQSF